MIMHYKNPKRPKRTICGHDSTIRGRTYSNVTSRLDNVNCQACLNAVRCNKLIKEMIKKGDIYENNYPPTNERSEVRQE